MTTRAVIHFTGEDLDDVLAFSRIKADVKKMMREGHELIIMHGGEIQFDRALKKRNWDAAKHTPPETLALRDETILELTKNFVSKLSDDLVPALALAAKDLGMVQIAASGDEPPHIVKVKAELLVAHLQKKVVPVISPLVRDGDGRSRMMTSEVIAAKLSAALGADMLIYVSETPKILGEGKPLEKLSEADAAEKNIIVPEAARAAWQSLREGTKQAFITTLSGMEKILLQSQPAPTELILMESI